MRAPADGTIVELLIEPGAVVRQGDPIAVLETGVPAAAPAPRTQAAGSGARRSRPRRPPPASPAARRLARELGVDLAAIAGSGPGGRIVEADVRAVGAPAAAQAGAPQRLPLSQRRRAIARRLTSGLASAAQLTLTAEADVTALHEELARVGAARVGAPR